jgi:type III secretory pathway component EscV
MCRSPFQIFCICAVCLTVLGCITDGQKESARMQKVAAEPTTLRLDCVQRVAENPEYDGIKTKLYFGADNQPPPEMLTDKLHPTKEQVRLLYKVRDDIQRCRKILLEGSAKTHPLILLTLVSSFVESDKLWVEATGGKLAWGAFNQRRKDISTQAQANLAQADTQIASQVQSRNENQSQLDTEQRQHAATAMEQWARQQEALANHQRAIFSESETRITTINCRYYGNGNTASCSLF